MIWIAKAKPKEASSLHSRATSLLCEQHQEFSAGLPIPTGAIAHSGHRRSAPGRLLMDSV
jgi:hypothetical protein